MIQGTRASFTVLAFALSAASAIAQGNGTLVEVTSPGTPQLFGSAIDEVGDVDQDGRPDFIVGDTYDGPGQLGAAWVFSGKDGTLIRSYFGTAFPAEFGKSVAGVGDVDNDGVPDHVVGERGSIGAGHPSRVHVYSGATGVELYTFSDAPQAALGWSVAGPGDINHDGHAEILVGAPWAANQSGVVRLYSGQTGQVFHQVVMPGFSYKFGEAVSGADDVDGDGFADFAAASNMAGESGFGTAFVFSGKTGQPLRTYHGLSYYISDLSLLGDTNLDGVGDLAIGQLYRADVYSGASGASLLTLTSPPDNSGFGVTLDSTGDANGDGRADMIVGAPVDSVLGASHGRFHVYTVLEGTELYSAYGDATISELATDVSGLGDVNLDGVPDVLAATWLDDKVFVLSGKYPTAVSYGTACPGFHDAIPTLEAFFTPPQETVSIRVTNIIQSTFAILVFGTTTAATPLPGGCVLNVGSPLPITVALPLTDGMIVVPGVPLPTGPFAVTMQALVADPSEPQGFSATQGLQVTVH